jgi:hypothetical protein
VIGTIWRQSRQSVAKESNPAAPVGHPRLMR